MRDEDLKWVGDKQPHLPRTMPEICGGDTRISPKELEGLRSQLAEAEGANAARIEALIVTAHFINLLIDAVHDPSKKDVKYPLKPLANRVSAALLPSAGHEMAERMRGMEGLLKRAHYIMDFHAARCPLDPHHNFSGHEEHLAEYTQVVEDIDAYLKGSEQR